MDLNNVLQVSINYDDFGALSVCALRYCQGRESYMPTLIRHIVLQHLSFISDRDLSILISDCEYQERANLYGYDEQDCIKFYKQLIEERNRRFL